MNIYNSNQIKCSLCGKFIGEVDLGSSLIFPLCYSCVKKEKGTLRRGISKILVPVDVTKKSTRAIDVAIYLAKHLGSSITLIQIIPKIKVGDVALPKTIFEEIQAKAKKTIEKAKKHCEQKNVSVKHRIVRGEKEEKIIETAKKSKFDLIVMGSSGKGALQEILFGSTSNFVMHNSDIPVLLVKETSPKFETKIKQTKSK